MPPLYDAHNHFQFDALAPHRAAIDATLRRNGLMRAVVNGTGESDWPAVAALARQYDWIIPSYGIHPWDCGDRVAGWQAKLRAAIAADPRAHVGEIGLDRWIVDGVRPDDPRIAGMRVAPMDEQTGVFAEQLALAAEFDRAASIHCTQAFGALHDVLLAASRPTGGFLLHGYGGPVEMVKTFADLGGYFSFNIEALSPRRAGVRESFQAVPADRLLVETDAPAYAPPPELNRHPLGVSPDGSVINHPANLVVAYEALAELRGLTPEALAAQVEQNFFRLFLR